MELPSYIPVKRETKLEKKKQGHSKGHKKRPMPRIADKTSYLLLVNAEDCVKNKITRRYDLAKT